MKLHNSCVVELVLHQLVNLVFFILTFLSLFPSSFFLNDYYLSHLNFMKPLYLDRLLACYFLRWF